MSLDDATTATRSPAHHGVRARRVVSGLDARGRSVIVVDEESSVTSTLPAFTCNDVWRAVHVPTRFDADELGAELEFAPPAGGITVRLVTFPPDGHVDRASYSETIDRFHGHELNTRPDAEVVGMHAMDTVDVDTVVSGEIWCVFDSGQETLLRQGDTIINRGTTHAWSNRSDAAATVVATIIPVRD